MAIRGNSGPALADRSAGLTGLSFPLIHPSDAATIASGVNERRRSARRATTPTRWLFRYQPDPSLRRGRRPTTSARAGSRRVGRCERSPAPLDSAAEGSERGHRSAARGDPRMRCDTTAWGLCVRAHKCGRFDSSHRAARVCACAQPVVLAVGSVNRDEIQNDDQVCRRR